MDVTVSFEALTFLLVLSLGVEVRVTFIKTTYLALQYLSSTDCIVGVKVSRCAVTTFSCLSRIQ